MVRSLKEQVATLKRAMELQGQKNSESEELIDILVKTAAEHEDVIGQLNEENYVLRSKIDHEREQYLRLIDVRDDEDLY